MGLGRRALLWASKQDWLGEQFRRRTFAKRAAARFIPGETVDAALSAAESFSKEGLTALVTQLGENVTTAEDAEAVTAHYLHVLDRIADSSLPCFISVKPTQLGLDIGQRLCGDNLSALLVRAKDTGSFVWVDMEASDYVDRTLELFESARDEYDNIGLCVQSYLHRTPRDVERLITRKAAVRLVKGAYNEPADLAFKCKQDVDASFLALAERLLEAVAAGEGGLPVFGTHDKKLLDKAFQYAAGLGLGKRSYEIQMLYGIAREYQLELAASGHEMRVLISYGASWFPWYMRRLAERPANVWFVMRSVFSR